MKKFYFSLVAMLLTSFAAFATEYKVDASKAITADATALDGVTAVVTDAAGEKTWAVFTGVDGQDINANCTSVLNWSSMSQYSYIKFFAVEGQADDVYYIKCVNANGEFYVPKGTWHDKSGCMNVTGNAGGLFIGGLAGQNGQDAANGALWKVQKTADGYTLYNIGKERYAVPGIGVTTAATAVKLYSEFAVFDAEAEGIFTGRMSNDKAKWANAGNDYQGGVERYAGGGLPEGEILSQTITDLPEGVYEVKFEAIPNVARDLDVAVWAGAGIAQAFANDQTLDLTVGTKSALVDADHTNGVVTFTCEITDGTLKYGMTNLKAGGQWYVVKAISLIRTGDIPKNTIEAGKYIVEANVALAAGIAEAMVPEAFKKYIGEYKTNAWIEGDEKSLVINENAEEGLFLGFEVVGDAVAFNADKKIVLGGKEFTVRAAGNEAEAGSLAITPANAEGEYKMDAADIYYNGMKIATVSDIKITVAPEDDDEPTDIDALDNCIYVEPADIMMGCTKELEINMKNAQDVKELSFAIELPEGIDIALDEDDEYDIYLDYSRIPVKKGVPQHSMATYKVGNEYRIAVISDAGLTIQGNEGSLIIMNLKASEDAKAGDYLIKFNNINLKDAEGNSIPGTEGTLTVKSQITITGGTNTEAVTEVSEAPAKNIKVAANGQLLIGNYNVAGQQVK